MLIVGDRRYHVGTLPYLVEAIAPRGLPLGDQSFFQIRICDK